MRLAPYALALAALAACAPIPVEEAERACLEDARLAKHPRGTIGIGMGSGGRAAAAGSVTVSSDFLLGRDPAAVFNSCVRARSGMMPTRPLYDQPGWAG